MLRSLLLLVAFAGAVAFQAPGVYAGVPARVAASPVMKKQGTSKSPPKDQKRRGKISKLCFVRSRTTAYMRMRARRPLMISAAHVQTPFVDVQRFVCTCTFA